MLPFLSSLRNLRVMLLYSSMPVSIPVLYHFPIIAQKTAFSHKPISPVRCLYSVMPYFHFAFLHMSLSSLHLRLRLRLRLRARLRLRLVRLRLRLRLRLLSRSRSRLCLRLCLHVPRLLGLMVECRGGSMPLASLHLRTHPGAAGET